MTPFDPQRRHRRSIRLKGYDYAQAGAYFVTICTHQRQSFFEEPATLQTAEKCWLAIPDYVPFVELDEWVVMPNHVHGVIVIDACRDVQLNVPTNDPTNVRTTDAPGGGGQLIAPTTAASKGVQSNAPTRDPTNPYSMMSPRRNTLSVIVRTYKAAVTTACRQIGRDDFAWQRNYYEHIVRNERELNAIRQYIQNNPLKWALDLDNPVNWKRRALKDTADIVHLYLHEAGL